MITSLEGDGTGSDVAGSHRVDLHHRGRLDPAEDRMPGMTDVDESRPLGARSGRWDRAGPGRC